MFFIGQWVWNKNFWEPPNSNLLISAIDLRPLAACAIAGGTPQGYGLFEYSSDPGNPDLIFIGNSLDDSITVSIRNAVEDRIGISRGTLASTTVRDLYWEVLTDVADPDNIRMCPPILPTKGGRLELHLANHSLIKSRAFEYKDDPLWPKILKIIKKDYAEIRDFSIRGGGRFNGRPDPNLHLRHLGELCQKYRCAPNDIHDTDIPIPPSTVLTESFNQTDSTTLGPDQTWTEFPSNLWETVSNQAQPITSALTNCTARVDSDLSGSDNQVTVDVTWKAGNNSEQGCAATRFSSSAETAYWGGARADTDRDIIGKVVSGTYSSLTNQIHSIGTETLTVVHKSDGSTISVNVGSFGELSTTDTSLTSGLRTGLRGITNPASSKLCSYDAWQGEDIVGAIQGNINYTLNLDTTFSGNITYAGSLNYTQNLDIIFTSSVTFSGTIDYTKSLDAVFNQSLILGGSLDLTNDLDATFNGSAILTGNVDYSLNLDTIFSGNLTHSGSVSFTNDLDLTPSAVITYSGSIDYINDFTTTFDGSLVGGAVQGNVAYITDLDLTQTAALILGGALALTNDLDITLIQSLTLGGFVDYTQNLDATFNGTMTYSGSIAYTNDFDITLDGTVAGQVSGNVDYTHSLDVTFTGGVNLSGAVDTTLDVDLVLLPKLTLGGNLDYTEDQTTSWSASMKRGGQVNYSLDMDLSLVGSVKAGGVLPLTLDSDITLVGSIPGSGFVEFYSGFKPFHPFGEI